MLSYHWTFWNWQSKPRSTCPTTMSCDYLSLKKEFRRRSSFGEFSTNGGNEEDSPQEEEMRRILHFRRIKGVLLLRRRRGERSRFSCWELKFTYDILVHLKCCVDDISMMWNNAMKKIEFKQRKRLKSSNNKDCMNCIT